MAKEQIKVSGKELAKKNTTKKTTPKKKKVVKKDDAVAVHEQCSRLAMEARKAEPKGGYSIDEIKDFTKRDIIIVIDHLKGIEKGNIRWADGKLVTGFVPVGGRKKGDVSLKTELKKILRENPEKVQKMLYKAIEDAEKGDFKKLELIMGYTDGKPGQTIKLKEVVSDERKQELLARWSKK